MIRKPLSLGMLTLVLPWFFACSQTPDRVVVTPPKLELLGQDVSKPLAASVLDKKGAPIEGCPVAWTSSNDAVATVDSAGLVTGRGTGEATVTAAAGQASATSLVLVQIVKSVTLELPASGLAGIPNATVPLKVTVTNEKNQEIAAPGLAFTSSDPAIATVDKSGVVTLLAPGPVTLKASLAKIEGKVDTNVLIQAPGAVKITKKSLAMKKGETAALEYSVLDEKGMEISNFSPVFKSSNEMVATIDSNGTVTGVGSGTATITIAAAAIQNAITVTVR